MRADVVAVVVNHGDPGDAIRCAAALRDQVGRILVVDNGSGPGTPAALRRAGLDVLARPANDGYAAGANAGFASTSEPYVLLLNADTVPGPAAVAALAAHLDGAPGCAVALPRIVDPRGGSQPSAQRRAPGPLDVFCELCVPVAMLRARFAALDGLRVHPRALRTGAPVAWGAGTALLVRRQAYAAAGPFDEGYFLYFEEIEFQERVRAAGWTVEWVGEAVIAHAEVGGLARPAPPAAWLASADRFLARRGHPAWQRRLALRGGLLGARIGLRAMAVVLPHRRGLWRRRAAAHDALARRAA